MDPDSIDAQDDRRAEAVRLISLAHDMLGDSEQVVRDYLAHALDALGQRTEGGLERD